MRKMFPNSLSNLVENTRDLLTRPSTEQAIKDHEADASSVQHKSATPQEKVDHQTPPVAEQKGKKRHIPFVALALVMLFTSLCSLSLLKMPPLALATLSGVPSTSTTPTPDTGPCSSLGDAQAPTMVQLDCVNSAPICDIYNLQSGKGTSTQQPGPCPWPPGSTFGGDYTACNQSFSASNFYEIELDCHGSPVDCATFIANIYDSTIGTTSITQGPCSWGSATPTATTVSEVASYDQTTAYLQSQGNATLGYGDSCDQFFTDVSIEGSQTFCWNKDDFYWGDRDISCIYNPAHKPGDTVNMNFSGTVTTGTGSIDTSTNIPISQDPGTTSVGGSVSVASMPKNQDTCADNSHTICMSDNASGNDTPGVANSQIHDQIGGDDIICSNNACGSNLTGTTDVCGDTNGKQLEYNRFACQMVDGTLQMGDQNSSYDSSLGAGRFWDKYWQSTGVSINPTAYDPNGALYLPTVLLHTSDVGPTRDRPQCASNGRWNCNSNDGSQEQVIILNYRADFARYHISSQYALASVPPFNLQVPVFWVACSDQTGGWTFPCSDKDASSNYGGDMPFISGEGNTQSLDNGQVNEGFIAKDWFSGDYNSQLDKQYTSADQIPEPGHLEYTYLLDTTNQAGIQKFLPIMLMIGYILMAPIIVLIGYQFLWSSWTLARASAMEALGRIILSILAVTVSYSLVTMLIGVANTLNEGIITLHTSLQYPPFSLNGQNYTFTLVPQGETDPASFRGIAVPISRWGCIGNDFVALLSNKFWTDAAGYVPFVGGIAKFIGNIFNAIDVAHHVGEFAVLILSITLCVQVLTRIILLNYYVLMAPVTFGCWGLPGGVGRNVVRSWAKGFFSLLFVQTIQIFILTTLPWILPNFPSVPSDTFGIINTALAQIPRVIILVAVIQVPKMMGTQATRAVAQAGTVAGGAVMAAGAMAMNTV